MVFPPRGRRLTVAQAELAVKQICQAMNIIGTVRLEPISRWQVTGEDGRAGASLVGVTRSPIPCLYHTRALTLEDIVHELLHVGHPDWREDRVVRHTQLFLAKCPKGSR